MALTVGTSISLRGPQGAPGVSFLVGSGAPTGMAVEGQGYLDADAGDVYRYTNGAWVKVRSIVGPMGMNGYSGQLLFLDHAPTADDYNGPGDALAVLQTGEVYAYDAEGAKEWVNTGYSLLGPAGPAGAAGQDGARGTMIYHDNKPFDPAVFVDARAGDLFFRDDQGTYAFIENA